MKDNHQDSQLKRELSKRHMQLIALGGSIGSVYFMTLVQPLKWQSRQSEE
ncbi:hypothetical protein ACM1TL_04205 [Lysinibacillus capsici]|nr:hypothetical protein [Lysinibacillus sp. YS11]